MDQFTWFSYNCGDYQVMLDFKSSLDFLADSTYHAIVIKLSQETFEWLIWVLTCKG